MIEIYSVYVKNREISYSSTRYTLHHVRKLVSILPVKKDIYLMG